MLVQEITVSEVTNKYVETMQMDDTVIQAIRKMYITNATNND